MKITTVVRANDVFQKYRIPGIAVTAKNTVLMYYEARHQPGDWENMEIQLFRSEDGGETFSEPFVMAAGTDELPVAGNPVCIPEPDGTLHFLYQRQYSIGGGSLYYRKSTDDGKTWSKPRDISAFCMPEYHNVFAFGPGHGICTSTGMLIVPVWMVPKDRNAGLTEHHPSVVSTCYSLDCGETWQLGELIMDSAEIPNPNETQIAELPDGTLYMNLRNQDTGYRARVWSKTGYSGWTKPELDLALPDPTCFGSCAAYHHNGVDALLFVNCANKINVRENIVCRASFDGGRTWERSVVVEPGDGGYVDIAVLGDGTVCVLYEQRFGVCDKLSENLWHSAVCPSPVPNRSSKTVSLPN